MATHGRRTDIPVLPESAPFSADQRLWLNGFLAGYFSRAPMPAGGNGAPAAAGAEPLMILFGSQTGTAEGLAKRFARDAAQRGFDPRILALNDHQQGPLTSAGKAVIICSTWGDGDPPDNAANFWSWLKADTAPRLETLQFAVLGLGDRNYADFCGASKKLDARLEALGARRLLPRGECDVDYEATAKRWCDSLWNHLGADVDPASSSARASDLAVVPGQIRGNGDHQHAEKGEGSEPAHDRNNPFPARLLKNVLLNKPGSGKEVRHYELELHGSGLTYEVGDALGVVPANCPELVNDLLRLLSASGEETVRVGDASLPLREALARRLDITKPTQELLGIVAGSPAAAELPALLVPGREDDLKQWLWGRDVIDLLRLLPAPPDLAQFVAMLRKLTPRLYSISSSPRAHPGEVHLTVGAVRYESRGRGRKGVASTFLADRVGEADFVRVFVQPSPGFKPPANGDAPMIMVGPGTGIAPFRAFLEDRRAAGAQGKNWLFFGDQQRATDLLYEEQLSAWHREGLLSRLDLAFSRDQVEKCYVQHRMLERAAEVWSWLEAGAHFYVCGDATRMARDVDAALHRIIEQAGGRSAEAARQFVAQLRSENRYQRDVY